MSIWSASNQSRDRKRLAGFRDVIAAGINPVFVSGRHPRGIGGEKQYRPIVYRLAKFAMSLAVSRLMSGQQMAKISVPWTVPITCRQRAETPLFNRRR